MGRAPCCDKANVKKGPWSPEEDAKLRDFIEKFGTGGNWIGLPQKAGLKRCGKSCRLRWLNYLRPNIKHGEFTDEEDKIICTLYSNIGSRWSIIAGQLPGRTDNDIKNYWNTKLKKKLMGLMVNPSNHNKFYPPFSSTNTFHHTQLLSQPLSSLYNSAYNYYSSSSSSQPTTSANNINISPPQNYLYYNNSTTSSNNLPLSTNNYYHHHYSCNYMNPLKDQDNNNNNNNNNMLIMFGGNDQASCSSSDGSCSQINKEHLMKQEEMVGGCYVQENQKFMLHYNNGGGGGGGGGGGDIINSFSGFVDEKPRINNGILESSGTDQLEYGILEEVKQLLISSSNCIISNTNCNLINDENKKSEDDDEKGMMYYY